MQVLDELKQRELGNTEKEEKMQVKKKTINLLPDADNNLLKLQVSVPSKMSVIKPSMELSFRETCVFFFLQVLVEASAKRVVNLASQWEKHRAPLIDEHRRLKEICSNQDVSGALEQHVHQTFVPVKTHFNCAHVFSNFSAGVIQKAV